MTDFERGPDFVCERRAPDALAAFARARRVASLGHKATDITVEDAAIEIARCTESEKVLSGEVEDDKDVGMRN